MTITEFLLARITEDEKVARAAAREGGGERWQISVVHSAMVQLDDGTEWGGETVVYDEGRPGEEQAAHIARHDPARVLAGCEAKRRVVELAASWSDHADRHPAGPDAVSAVLKAQAITAETVLRTLAREWADHPDYREEWPA